MIDGAVRDVDEIKALNYPVFARVIVSNAGDMKRCREIGVEIMCGG